MTLTCGMKRMAKSIKHFLTQDHKTVKQGQYSHVEKAEIIAKEEKYFRQTQLALESSKAYGETILCLGEVQHGWNR